MHADELECPECSVLMSDTAEKEASLRKRVLEERNALKSLTSAQVLHLEHGIQYMLVPQMWMASWRSWVTGTPWKARLPFPFASAFAAFELMIPASPELLRAVAIAGWARSPLRIAGAPSLWGRRDSGALYFVLL